MNTDEQAQTDELTPQEVKRVQDFLKSRELLLNYIAQSGRLSVVFDGELYIECPSLMCHSYCYAFGYIGEFRRDGLNEKQRETLKKRLSARLIVERGTGIARIACNTCGANWDIFGLYQTEHKCDRHTAISRIYDVVTSGQFERLAIDPLGRLLESERES